MRFLEKFSTSIFNLLPQNLFSWWKKGSRLLKLRDADSIGNVLKRGVALIDDVTRRECRAWLFSQQTLEGGFPDRGGKCDLYYTLFGFFLAEAFDMEIVLNRLKTYVKTIVRQRNHEGTDLFCLAILHASLFPGDPETGRFVKKIRNLTGKSATQENGYQRFLVILSLMYLRDFASVLRELKSVGKGVTGIGKPCPVVAAQGILDFIKSGLAQADAEPIMTYYRENGGFAAFSDTPGPDLLSTSVALFALQLKGYDLRFIRPDCMTFINGLYYQGGFRAALQDTEVDVEYTFYGLLALGAIKRPSK
jgi:hypothetical protein